MKRALLLAVALTVFGVFAGEAAAQGRGRGHNNSNWDKKCGKFVNCHDARDGRWDNRGPRRRMTINDRYYSPYSRSRTMRNRRYERGDRVYVNRRYRRN